MESHMNEPAALGVPVQHQCAYPASGCTHPACDVASARHDQRVVEALMRVDYDQRVTAATETQVECAAVVGAHSWPAHRRHLAEAQLTELQRVGLIPTTSQEEKRHA